MLDLISGGRVSYAFGVGHREEEYAHFGVDMAARGGLADEYLRVLIALVRGEAVEFRGRRVRVTPRCTSANGPPMMIAGGSKAAVRRAAAHGLGFISQVDRPELRTYYEAQCRQLGKVPGFVQFPVPDSPTVVFVADDVDQAWQQLGPHLLHDAAMAASYRHGDDSVASITRASTVAELRLSGGPYRILTPSAATEFVRSGQSLPLHPLCGGIEPEVGLALPGGCGGGPPESRDGSRMSKEESMAVAHPGGRLVDRRGRLGCHRRGPESAGPETRWRVGSFARESRQRRG